MREKARKTLYSILLLYTYIYVAADERELENKGPEDQLNGHVLHLDIMNLLVGSGPGATKGDSGCATVSFLVTKSGLFKRLSNEELAETKASSRTVIPIHLLKSKSKDSLIEVKSGGLTPIEVELQIGREEARETEESLSAVPSGTEWSSKEIQTEPVSLSNTPCQTEEFFKDNHAACDENTLPQSTEQVSRSFVHSEAQTEEVPVVIRTSAQSTIEVTNSYIQTEPDLSDHSIQTSIESTETSSQTEGINLDFKGSVLHNVVDYATNSSQTDEVPVVIRNSDQSTIEVTHSSIQTDSNISENFSHTSINSTETSAQTEEIKFNLEKEKQVSNCWVQTDLDFGEDFSSRTISPRSQGDSPTRPLSPVVQDNVVARVLLEHVGTVCSPPDPRRSVNYLDLSRLGEEGETPASDEIWLAVGDGEGEDKFLSSDDDDTNTYSVATDKLSTAATMDGHVATEQPVVAPQPVNLLEVVSPDIAGRSSFDAEVESTARIQGVLADELMPIKSTLNLTGTNVIEVSGKIEQMEGMLTSLCSTVDKLSSRLERADESTTPKPDGAQDARDGSSRSGLASADLGVLDQLVSRIEHLSTGVANIDATRQLREDNLLLRKDLQQYRDRELLLISRMEALEKKISDGKPKQTRSLSRGRRSSSESSEAVELPPIAGERIKSAEKKVEKKSESETKPLTKAPLMSPTRTKKAVIRKTSSSSDELEKPKKLAPVQAKPLTPRMEADSLQTEIQIARADNSILRQDIQVFRERENQLARRNMELEDKLIEQSNEIITLAKHRKTPAGSDQDEDKTEVNINVDFHTTDKPKAVFTEATKKEEPKKEESKEEITKDESKPTEAKGKVSREPSKERKSKAKSGSSSEEDKVDKKKVEPLSKKRSLSKDKKSSSTSSSSSSDEDKGSKKATSSEGEAKKSSDEQKSSTASGVPKAKIAQKKVTPPKGKKSREPSTERGATVDEKTLSKSKSKLVEGEEWKVTISSEHTLETSADTPRKTITVTPKPQEKKKAEVGKVQAKTAKVTSNKGTAKGKVEKKAVKDPRSDPIPKPPQFPAPRPPRGYVPLKQVPNSSAGVTMSIHSPLGGSPMVPRKDHVMFSTPPRSGRSSAASDHGDTIHMLIKQDSRDSNVDSAPPICQVSYDSIYDDPYYHYYWNKVLNRLILCLEARNLILDVFSQVRESPDGANSSVLDCKSRASTALDAMDDLGSNNEEEHDVIMEFVLMDEDQVNRKSPFKKYADSVKESVIKDHFKPMRKSLRDSGRLLPDRPRRKPVSVSHHKNSMRARSLSSDNIVQEPMAAAKKGHSVERLPTLTAFEEERIVWLKNLEDDIQFDEERRKRNLFRRQMAEDSSSSSSSTPTSTSLGVNLRLQTVQVPHRCEWHRSGFGERKWRHRSRYFVRNWFSRNCQ